MDLIRWKPFDEMEKFFHHGFDLAVDVYEDGNNIIAEMAAPDVDPNKIEISIDGNLLHVKGSREQTKEKKNKNFYSKEIRRGSFERTITLPRAVIADKTKANYKDGVLKVTLLAKETAKPIKVKVESKK